MAIIIDIENLSPGDFAVVNKLGYDSPEDIVPLPKK